MLKILGFADFHGSISSGKRASHVVSAERPNLVVVAGDLANRDLQVATHILEQLSESGTRVVFVPGNMDDPRLANWRSTERIVCLHGRSAVYDTVLFVGLGGAVRSPFEAPFEFDEVEAAEILSQLVRTDSSQTLVLVSHCPPKNTRLDLAAGVKHVGSESVRQFIEERKPSVVITGHIHEARGLDSIGSVPIVNVGAAAHGDYALISLEKPVKIELRKL